MAVEKKRLGILLSGRGSNFLAIADSIIRATQASCTIGTASTGGARFEVTWRLATPRAAGPGSLEVGDH